MHQNKHIANSIVHPVFPTIWKNIGKSEQDKARWGVKKKCAEDFEKLHGWLVEF